MPSRKKSSVITNEPQRVFMLGGVKLLPHFLQKDAFVAPGNPKVFSTEELIQLGAEPGWHCLWPRANLPEAEAQAELERMRAPILIKKKADIQRGVNV